MFEFMLSTVYRVIDTFTKFKVRVVNEDGIVPQKADDGCAGYDVYSRIATVIPSGQRQLIPIGISTEISNTFYLRVAPRSGLSVKGIDVGAGVTDSSYRGEIKVLIINNSLVDFYVDKGAKIAQIILERCSNATIMLVDELSETERGYGGFGSTGKF
jgi:dUTP pyrophosphatase